MNKKLILLIVFLIIFIFPETAYSKGGYTKVLQINPSKEQIEQEKLRQESELKKLELEKLEEENKKAEAENKKLESEILKNGQQPIYYPLPYYTNIIQYRNPVYYPYGGYMGSFNYRGFGFNYGKKYPPFGPSPQTGIRPPIPPANPNRPPAKPPMHPNNHHHGH